MAMIVVDPSCVRQRNVEIGSVRILQSVRQKTCACSQELRERANFTMVGILLTYHYVAVVRTTCFDMAIPLPYLSRGAADKIHHPK